MAEGKGDPVRGAMLASDAARAAAEAGLRSPERIGLLPVMGTDLATKAAISCLRYAYRAMGHLAVEAPGSGQAVQQMLEPQPVTGPTT